MSAPRIVSTIARWEFARWFKIKTAVVTLVVSLIAALTFGGVRYWMDKADKEPLRIAVLNGQVLPLSGSIESRFEFLPSDGRQENDLRAGVASGEFDALLIIRSLDTVLLLVVRNQGWQSELFERLNQERQRAKITEMQISQEQLADMMAPVDLEVAYVVERSAPATFADKIASMLLIAVMILGIFNSLGCQMVTITGEKQQRMTEQILSAVSPQQWMDGKILGTSLFASVYTGILVVGTVIFILVSEIFGQRFPVPMEFGSPGLLILMMLATAGGFLLWNVFFAAVASIVNDPNVSSKTGVMFLPIIISVLPAVLVLKTPDGSLAVILTLLPFTSPAVLPARLVLTMIPAWQIAVSLLLLALAIWLARWAAGKTFRLGMLMFGKEPSFKEVFRWIREA